MGIVEFLLARAADLETDARAVPGTDQVWIDPDLILAEVEAKRRIVNAIGEADPHAAYITATFTGWDVLRLLALPYADHPDYDPSWRP